MAHRTARQYAEDLIRFDSVSCQTNADVADYLRDLLAAREFDVEPIQYQDRNGITKVNLVARRGSGPAGLAYFCHSDVVPADDWADDRHGPFEPHVQGGRLYGRGSCDMKGSIACMLAAIDRLAGTGVTFPLYFVCTADEEVGFVGARNVVAQSALYREIVQAGGRAIVGEPTRRQVVYAHKGICQMRAIAYGRAAHSSTSEGINANLSMIPFLVEAKAMYERTLSDPDLQNDEFDPPHVCCNISICDYNRASNITPARSVCTISIRPLPGRSVDGLIAEVRDQASRHGLEFQVDIRSDPFYTDPAGPFVQECVSLAGVDRPQTVSYGTDAGEFAELDHVVVCGPGSIAQAHTNHEWISLEELDEGTNLYEKFVRRWCCQ
jgi:acetylornithine deacetylase